MARRKKTPKSPERPSKFQTHYLEFSEKERIEIVSLIGDNPTLSSDEIEECTTDGWKLSFSFSSLWGTYVCSLTPKDVADFSSSTVYIFRHQDFTRVVGFLRFFFGVMIPNRDSRLEGEVTDTAW
jgi:hypothetical protein